MCCRKHIRRGLMTLLPFFLCTRLSGTAVIRYIFPFREALFQGTRLLCAISCMALPGHSVDVDSPHISYADIFISKVRAACGSSLQSQVTVEDAFWNAIILHTADIAQPSQYALSKESIHNERSLRCLARICPGCFRLMLFVSSHASDEYPCKTV